MRLTSPFGLLAITLGGAGLALAGPPIVAPPIKQLPTALPKTKIPVLTADAGAASSCQITLSGAVSGTFTCVATASYQSATNASEISLNVMAPAPLRAINASFQRPNPLTSGTWTNGNPGTQAGVVVAQTNATWTATVGTSSPSQGNFALNLPSVSVASEVQGGKTLHASGTLSANLPALAGTGSAGMVTMAATFSF